MMNMNNKKLMFTLLLFIFISSITVVSAVDVSDNVTSTDYQVSTDNTISVDIQPVGEDNNIENNVNEIEELSNDKSVKSLNRGNIHTINSESYSTYFTNGVLNNAAQDGDVILINDTFEGSSFIFDKSINLTSTQNGILRNCIITFNSNADYSNVTNLNIVNIDDDANDGINVYSATNMTIEDNIIYIDSNNTAKGITLNNADGTIIYNNDITVNAYTNEVTYYYEDNYANPAGTVETAGIGVYNSSYTNVESNTVTMTSTGYHPQRGTLVGIAVQGNIVTKSSQSLYPVEVNYNTIKNNIVNLDGNLYAYGITLHYFARNNIIINNTITADSSTKFYVCGIQASYLVQYNQIYNNKINLTALNFTYGINSQGLPGYNGHNYYNNNSINLSSIYTRGIESFNGYYDNITYNVILVDGDYSNGIGLGGTYGNNITFNVINSTGTIFTIDTSTADDIPFKTDGIYVNSSHYYDNNGNLQTNLSIKNNIHHNYILTNGEYAIDLYGQNNPIYYNYINSAINSGNDAVNVIGTNLCYYNFAYTTPNFLNNRISLLKANKLKTASLKSDSLIDNEITTHVITNDNWRTFFTTEGLNSSLVSDDDVLDLQGEISIDHNIKIDKPVNITSTTNDGKIYSRYNESTISYNVFEINNKGSHSNLTNICLYNTQLILYGADYINIDHINVTTENCAGLGSGKGVTSIREGCDFINITNSYFYVYNNGGSSNLVLAGSGFVNVENNTIHSEGFVGNVVYLNFYNVENQTNQFINITNNNLIGPTDPAQICWLIALNSGNDVLIKGNNLTYTGDGIINGVPNLRIEDNNFNNVTNIELWTDAEIINNTGIHNIKVTGPKLITGNEINGDCFRLYCGKDSVISNNNIKINSSGYYDNLINCDKFVFENNTYDSVGSLNIVGSHGSIIQNNTITTTAYYSINLTNSSANVIRNNTLIASELRSDFSVNGPGDYVENNNPTTDEYDVLVAPINLADLEFMFMMFQDIPPKNIYIYLEDSTYSGDTIIMDIPDKTLTIDGSHLHNDNYDINRKFIKVNQGSLVLKNLKIEVSSEYNDGFLCNEAGNITLENCFINIKAPTLSSLIYNPRNPLINNKGNGYISIKSCTIINNYDWYTTLTSAKELYIIDSIILGSDIKPYNADNKPETLDIRQNYINSYDKIKYSSVQDEVVAMVNGVVDSKNIIQVTGKEKVVVKLVADTASSYDNIINQLGYESGVFLGSTNEEVISTTGLMFNKNNDYTITLDEQDVDETVTLYAYVLDRANTEKKLMDIVEYVPTEKTSVNINLSTLTYGADNQIIINITDVDGNLIQASGLIDVSIDGEEYTTYYFKNGELKIPYKITSPDDITIFVAYGGNDKYSKSNNTAIFTPIILDMPTNISITAQAETKVNSTIPVTIILTADDNLLTGQEIIVSTSIGDETVALTKGFIVYQYTPATVGEETITVTFNANGRYLASSANATISVTEDKDAIIEELNNQLNDLTSTVDTNISVDEFGDVIYNTNLTVSGRLVDAEGNVLADSYVVVTFNGDENIVKTDSNGVYSFVAKVNNMGVNKVSVNYEGTGKYNPSVVDKTFDVTKADCIVAVDEIADTVYGDNVTITGTFTNVMGDALINSRVTVTVNGNAHHAKTNSDGHYTLTVKANTVGTNNVTVGYAGNAKYNKYTSDLVTFNVIKSDCIVTIDTINDAVYKDNVTITGRFTTAGGVALKNSQVIVYINGASHTVKTDNNGVYTIITKATATGINNVTATYKGNAKYNAYTSEITTFNVAKKTVKLSMDKVNVKDNTVTVSGKFTDRDGKVLTNSKVTVILNGKKYSAKTDNEGLYTFNTTTTDNIIELTVVYAGNARYEAYTSDSLTLTRA